jgi:Secretion system C-terminal sorting domain
MKKITLLILMTLGFVNSLIAQEWDWVFTTTPFGTPPNNIVGIDDIALDANGNIYSTCWTNSPAVGIGDNTFDLPPGAEDMSFQIRHDNSGNILSVIPTTPNGEKILFDTSGNAYHLGSFSGTLVLGSITLTSTESDVSNMFIAKIDSDGNYIWAKKAEALGETAYRLSANDFLLDQQGDIYISGTLEGESAVFGDLSFTANGASSVFLVKYDTNGNAVWLRNGIGESRNGFIVCDSQNNICMLGRFRDPTIIFGDIVLQNMCNTSAFLVKYDPAGNVIWAKKYGGTGTGIDASATYPYNIAIDDMDNIYAIGGFRGDHTKFGTITLNNFNPDFDCAFMVKLNSFGDPILAKSVGGDNQGVLLRDVHVSANGTMYVVGVFSSSTITLGNTSLTNQGEVNSYIARLDTNGNYEWVRHIGGTKNVWAWDIDIDETHSAMYIAGMYNEMVIGDETFATESGINNGFLSKLSLVPLSNEEFQQNSLSIFPNPAQNILNINNELTLGQAYNISDMTGRTIKSGIAESAIDVSSLSSGLYNLTINNASVKFVKQ